MHAVWRPITQPATAEGRGPQLQCISFKVAPAHSAQHASNHRGSRKLGSVQDAFSVDWCVPGSRLACIMHESACSSFCESTASWQRHVQARSGWYTQSWID
jgi:hypothetical protein